MWPLASPRFPHPSILTSMMEEFFHGPFYRIPLRPLETSLDFFVRAQNNGAAISVCIPSIFSERTMILVRADRCAGICSLPRASKRYLMRSGAE